MQGQPARPAAAGHPLLDLEGVSRWRGSGGDAFVLDVRRFLLRPGEKLAVVGRSGSGKSTFLDLLALTLSPSSARRFVFSALGEISEIAGLWQARSLGDLAALRARHIGYILQTGGLLPFLTARENILLPLRVLGRRDFAPADRLMERLEVAALGRRRPADLSIGQRQRVAIARALVHAPALVLADEPTASLDTANADIVMQLFADLVREENCAAILVTHNAAQASAFGFQTVPCRPQIGLDRESRGVIDWPGESPTGVLPTGDSSLEEAP